MTRNYDNPITILFSGSGMSTLANTSALLEDFVFGNADKVDAKVILVDTEHAKGLSIAIDVLNSWGIDQESGDLVTVSTFQGAVAGLLGVKDEGRDVYFISLFEPGNAQDLAEIERVKKAEGIVTLNLCESLVDHFEGYESEADRTHREAVEEAFAEQQAAKEAETPKPVRKTAAKKATTPRKRTASKTLEPESKPLEAEPEKPSESPRMSVGDTVTVGGVHFTKKADSPFPDHNKGGLDALVAGAVARDEERSKARKEKLELSGTIVMGTPKLPAELEPVKPIEPVVESTPDVWRDIAAAVPADASHISISKADFIQLGSGIQKMAEGFAETLEVYKRMVQ